MTEKKPTVEAELRDRVKVLRARAERHRLEAADLQNSCDRELRRAQEADDLASEYAAAILTLSR